MKQELRKQIEEVGRIIDRTPHDRYLVVRIYDNGILYYGVGSQFTRDIHLADVFSYRVARELLEQMRSKRTGEYSLIKVRDFYMRRKMKLISQFIKSNKQT